MAVTRPAAAVGLLFVAVLLVACPGAPPALSPLPTREPTPTETERPRRTDEASPTPTPGGTDAGDVGGSEGNIYRLAAGDCLNFVDALTNTVETVDCDVEHEYEVYGVLDFPADADDEWPGETELGTFAAGCTDEPFESYVGVPYTESSWYSAELQPTEDEWDDGVRKVVCLLYHAAEERTEGTARGSGG